MEPAGVTTFWRLSASKIVAGADAERREPGVGKLDKDALGALAKDVDFFDAAQRAAGAGAVSSASRVNCRGGMPDRLDRIEREGDIGIFVVDERSDGRHAASLSASSPSFFRA